MLTTPANWSKGYKLNPLCSHSYLCVRETNIIGSRVPKNQYTKFSIKNVIQFYICSTVSFGSFFEFFKFCIYIILTPEFVWSTPWNSYCPCVTCDKHNVTPNRHWQISVNLTFSLNIQCTPNLDNVFCC